MESFYSKIRFDNYYLDNITLETKREPFEEPKFDFNPAIAFDEDDKVGGLKVQFSIEDRATSLKGECFAFFSYDENLTKDDASSLIAHNGLTILFPYLRSAITNFTTAANVNPIIIPTINILELIKEKLENLENGFFSSSVK